MHFGMVVFYDEPGEGKTTPKTIFSSSIERRNTPKTIDKSLLRQEISKRRLSATLISRLFFFRTQQTLSHFHECKPTHLCSSHRLSFDNACGNPLFHAAKEGPSRLAYLGSRTCAELDLVIFSLFVS